MNGKGGNAGYRQNKRMSHIYLDKAEADACVKNIERQIEQLQTAANTIDAAMVRLSSAWKGSSADKAQSTYQTEFRTLLTRTIPTATTEFKRFMGDCVRSIFDTDQMLSGRG